MSDLQPGTRYHFRFVASNALGTVSGAEAAFSTHVAVAAGASTLPDGRVYELVSSPTSNADVHETDGDLGLVEGGEGKDATFRLVRAAADGDAVVYVADPPPEGMGAGSFVIGDTYLAMRGVGGWTQTSLQLRDGLEYEGFTGDLSVGILNPALDESIGDERPSPSTPVAPTNCEHGSLLYSYDTGDGGYHALFGATPTPAPTYCQGYFAGGNAGTGTMPQYSDLLFEGMNHPTPEASRTRPATGQAIYDNLYDAVGGQLHLINVLPDGEPEPEPVNAKFVGTNVQDNNGAGEQGSPEDISASGSRVFWRSESSGDIYVRKNPAQLQSPVNAKDECEVPADACTVQVSVGAAEFWAASTEGTYVFYTEGGQVWRFDVETSERLAFIGDSATGTGNFSAAIGAGTVTEGSKLLTGVETSTGAFAVGMTISGDYSQARGDSVITFAPGTTITAVEPAGPGTLELSVPAKFVSFGSEKETLEAGFTEVTLLVTTSGSFSPGERVFGTGIEAGTTITEVKPHSLVLSKQEIASGTGVAFGVNPEVEGVIGVNETGEEGGAYIYFVAENTLTGENAEHRKPTGGEPNLYLSHDGVTTFIATLARATDNGERYGDWAVEAGRRTAEVTPDGHNVVFSSVNQLTGFENRNMNELYVYDADTGLLACASCNPDGVAEAPAELSISERDTFTLRSISEDGGRVFFSTTSALVPQDVNGMQNVYEWEREGEGSCPAGRRSGCIYLLSGGTSGDNAFFLDASANGDDVFFLSRGQLVPQARSENMALYDARVGGGFPESALACTGTGCQGLPPAPPIFSTPSSMTFNGVGDFPPSAPVVVKPPGKKKVAKCKRGSVKSKQGKCVKRPKSRKAKKSAKGRK